MPVVSYHVGFLSGLLTPFATLRSLLEAGGSTSKTLIAGYETTTVEAVDGDTGESLATVEARVADGFIKRYVGLSATEELGEGEGMLFVHGDAAERAYVMRETAFPLDIVFVAPNGTVTTVHEAAPESPPYTRYRGTGRYVLEVPRGWSERNGVEPGDRIRIDSE